MYIFTNNTRFGGTFDDKIQPLLRRSTSATIASGYTSEDVLQRYRGDFSRIVGGGGDVTLLIGMAIFEGLSQSTYNTLRDINQRLLSVNPECGGVKVVWDSAGFHGKIYKFLCGQESYYFAGSSNFSRAGLTVNLEFTSQIIDSDIITETENYLSWLLDYRQSVNIARIEPFPIIERATAPVRMRRRARRPVLPPPGTPYVDIILREDQHLKSGLNAFFGKGRWNRVADVVTPRDWFEVEIIADIESTRHPIYPHGDFNARTVDGDRFPCSTHGSYDKNLRSKDDLKILGRWIKGKLQVSGALRPFERVTSRILEAYGRNYIRLHRLSETEYLLDF